VASSTVSVWSAFSMSRRLLLGVVLAVRSVERPGRGSRLGGRRGQRRGNYRLGLYREMGRETAPLPDITSNASELVRVGPDD
jgi:hypothetical protein